MMPDRYEELKKRAQLAQIQPQFQFDGQNLPYNLQEEEVVAPTPIQEEVVDRKPLSIDGLSANYIADAVTAGGPGLLAFLGGASPAVTSALFDKGNAYAQARGKQEEITKANTSVIDDNGEPLNVRTRDAVGKKPYYQSKGSGGGSLSNDRQYPPVTLKNVNKNSTDYGKIAGAITMGSGYYNPETKERYSMTDWLPFKAPIILRERTMQGGQVAKTADPYNPTGSTPGVISSQSGLGDVFGGISKEEAQAGIRSAEKGKASSQKSVEAYQNAKASYDVLSNPNLTPEMAAAGIVSIVKATNGERLSDSDYANLRGEEFKSYLREFEDWSSGKIVGEINPKIVEAYKEVAEQVMRSKKAEAEAIKSNYVPSNLIPSKSGQKKLDTAVGKSSAQDKSWKSKFKDL